MPSGSFKCPQCGKKYETKKIIANNYACPNSGCDLNIRLLVHGEMSATGKLSKLYGWVLQPGTVLHKKYEIVRMIGKGGFGATYLAQDKSMFGQMRAIKEIPKAYCDDREDEFLTVLDHSCIPKLYERFNTGKFHYSVMEYVEGRSLEDLVKKGAGWPEAKVLNLARQLCDVLGYIHSKNVVHRDLKPENILVRKSGKISLIDFGIAKRHIVGHGTRHLARAASYFYSSPEQYQAGKGYTDFKSDIYSLGAILYFLTTGVEPIDALSRDPANDISPMPRSLNRHISPKLEEVIVRAMKMRKTERFKDVQAMTDALPGNGKTRSTKTCPKCQALMAPENKFCPNCGYSTRPLTPSSGQTFIFKSGKQATSIAQLVRNCYDDWHEAVTYLYNRDFEKWLKLQPDGKALVKKAAAIRKTYKDKNLGLNEFLMASGYGIAAQLKITPTAIDLGQVLKGNDRNLVLTITNNGKGILSAKIVSNNRWLRIERQAVLCPENVSRRVVVTVAVKHLVPGKQYRTGIRIQSNGGSATIPLTISVKPAAMSARQRPAIRQPANPRPFHHGKKSGGMKNLLKSIFLFAAIALLTCYLGPTADMAIASPAIIAVMAIAMVVVSRGYGKTGLVLGLLMGSSLGAMLNIISYFVYPIINGKLVIPAMELLDIEKSTRAIYTGWGLLGLYLGAMVGICGRWGKRG